MSEIMRGGLILEAPRFKNFTHEKVFGAAPILEKIEPLNRDISGIPVVFQGNVNTCVSCALTWIRQYLDKEKPDLSWEWLAEISRTGQAGAKPSQVLEPARKNGILKQDKWDEGLAKTDFDEALQEAYPFCIPSYFYVTDLSKYGIYHALKSSPLAIGVENFMGVGPHFMAAFDVTEDGQRLKCANWWKDGEQDVKEVPFEDVIIAVAFGSLPDGVDKKLARAPFFDVFCGKLRFFFKNYVSTP